MVHRLGPGAETIIGESLPRFLMWQLMQSIPVYLFGKALVSPATTLFAAVNAFIFFQLSLLVFSTSLFLASSPQPFGGVSAAEFLSCLHKLVIVFVYGGSEYSRRDRVILRFVLFLACSGVSASMAVVCLYGSVLALGLIRGFIIGLVYGLCYKIWVYDFDMIQRAPFHRYKLAVGKAFIEALKLACVGGGVCLLVSVLLLPISTTDLNLIEHLVFCFASFVVLLCWELNRSLLQVLLTKRLVFAPPTMGGSAAAEPEKNPTDYIIEAIEDTTSPHIVQYLAYLDLCMVSESNFDTWRRAALFEGTGETYKKVIDLCLDPLQQLTLDLISCESNQSIKLSNEPFYQLQVCMWGARIASSLMVRSIKEDDLGVARGSYAAVLSTLLSCLLAVEAFLKGEKKTGLDQSTNPPGPTAKAYSMAAILRTSIYQIVWNFHEKFVISSRDGLLEQEWVVASGSNHPLYGSRELLAHKLQMFLDFQAN